MSRIVRPPLYQPLIPIVEETDETRRLRVEWALRQRPVCMVCGKRVYDLTVDHIIGGNGRRSDQVENWLWVGWVCCHSKKHDLGGRLPLFIAAKSICDPSNFSEVILEGLRGQALPSEWLAIRQFAESCVVRGPVF